jgi:GNAT superfamily N-acetyltransferase
MIYRRFLPDDKPAVMSLLVSSYGGWHGDKNEAYWTWKFDRNPHGRARIYVGDDDGKVAGCYILLPMTLRVRDATTRGLQSVDAAVSGDYRGRGVFTNLARTAIKEAIDDGFGTIFAFPTPGAHIGQVRAGFTPKMVVPLTVRPLLWPPKAKRVPGLVVNEVGTIDARFDPLDTCRLDGHVRVQRDHAFLHWRYDQHPTQTYETIICERGGEMCGYSVLAVGAARGYSTEGYIADLQVLPDAKAAATLLVNDSLRRLRSLGARIAVSWVRPGGHERDALASAGFSPTYVSVKRLVKRPDYIGQLITFDPDGTSAREQRHEPSVVDSLPWSLVPGDADYV